MLLVVLSACTPEVVTHTVTKTVTVTVTVPGSSTDPATTPNATTTTSSPTTSTTSTTTPTTPAPTSARVATWNVETLGAPGTDQYEAVRDVLLRLNADVVALNEVDDGEEDYVVELAGELGLDAVVVADTNPFGALHNAVMTRLPVVSSAIWTSADLSADPDANDLTRWPVAVEVEVPGGTLAVVSEHWKSGFEVIDEFRRVLDSVRVAQAAAAAGADGVVALGDMNAEVGEDTIVDTWYYLPVDAPSSYVVGSDLQAELDGDGIPDDAFLPLTDLGLVRVDALQRDGEPGTRDESGRIIDHLHASAAVVVQGAEVYDCRDDGLPGLPLSGTPPDVDACATGSDHFPVYADLSVAP